MHRIDFLLDSVQIQDISLEGSACDVLHEALNTLQEIVVDSKRCSSFVWFYLDSSSRTGTTSQSVLLLELASTKGNILCILDVLNRAKSLPILRRVVKLFRSILENPAAASLARSKPAVRRKIAEVRGHGAITFHSLTRDTVLHISWQEADEEAAREAPAQLLKLSGQVGSGRVK